MTGFEEETEQCLSALHQEDDKRRQRQPQTESERLKAAEDAAIRARASLQLEEERDEVKRMNRMMLYSRCVTIR